jgi:hypothetical protein
MGEAKRRKQNSRQCGGCTACCSTLGVRELALRPFHACLHICETGCSIYPDRPTSCREWSCMWLLTPDLPDAMRPDRCGVVINPDPEMIKLDGKELPAYELYMLPERADAMKNQEVQRLVEKITGRLKTARKPLEAVRQSTKLVRAVQVVLQLLFTLREEKEMRAVHHVAALASGFAAPMIRHRRG